MEIVDDVSMIAAEQYVGRMPTSTRTVLLKPALR